jgi:phosphoglycolate phosphatase-like HAD superfamily hydrolase
MKAYYQAADDLRALPYAEEMFRLLHQNNIRVALNTDFTKAITEAITGRLGWDKNGLVDCVISSDEVPQGRPLSLYDRIDHGKGKRFGCKNVVKVGDTEVDIAEGRNAGCGSVISVTTGSYSR